MATPNPTLLDQLRVKIGLAVGDASRDAEIIEVYSAVLQWLEDYLDRWLEPGIRIEQFVHVAGYGISLRGYPIDVYNGFTVTGDGESVTAAHLDSGNGWLHFDGHRAFHEVTVKYSQMDPIRGPLLLAVLALFDAYWGQVHGGGAVAGGGAIKAISNDGARIEFDTSGGGSSLSGTDPLSGLPSMVAAMLEPYRRRLC